MDIRITGRAGQVTIGIGEAVALQQAFGAWVALALTVLTLWMITDR